MKQDLISKECLIVCDQKYNQPLYKFKNTYPDLKFKIISINEFIDRISFSYFKDVLPILISHNIEYSKAKKFSSLLRVADIDKNENLKEVFGYIPSEYISRDPYGLLELGQKKIYLFELDEDVELKALLERNGLHYEDLHFEDLDFEVCESFNTPNIHLFQNKYVQFFYIFSDIRKRILENPNCINKIKLVIDDDSDLFYVKVFGDIFDIKCYATVNTPLISDSLVKEKVRSIYANKSFVFTEDELENDSLKSLRYLIDQYGLEELGDFSYAYANLLEIISSTGTLSLLDDKGITVTNKFDFDTDSIIYLTNFKHGSFYKVYDDKNVLNDTELVKVSANASYVRTKLDRRLKLNYIKYQNIVIFSRVKQHLSDSIYNSQFMDKNEFDWERTYKDEILNKSDFNLKGSYTSKASKLFSRDQYDRYAFTDKAFLESNSYDHSFKGLDDNKSIIRPSKHWSVTNLESYVNCPYQYYLKAIIPSSDGDPHNKWKGTFTHKVFETINQSNFDLEKATEEGRKAYIDQCISEGFEFGLKEEVYIDIISYWLRKFIPTYIRSYKDMHLVEHKKDHEVEIYFSLFDENNKEYKFSGRIDKLLYTEFENEKFYTVVDYKSGKEEFKPERLFLGTSTQLPLYYYAIESSNEDIKKDSKFGGAVIQHNYFKTIKEALKDNNQLSEFALKKASKLVGLSCSDPNYIHSIDETAFKDSGELLVKGGTVLGLKNGATFTLQEEHEVFNKVDEPLEENAFKKYIDTAIRSTLETIKKIENNNFEIAPGVFEKLTPQTMTPCSYCPYRDVCYRKLRDIISYKDLIDATKKNK